MTDATPTGDAQVELNPTPEMLADPRFEAIWQTIKGWDVRAPWQGGGYSGATGSHVAYIYNAIAALEVADTPTEPIAEMVAIYRDIFAEITAKAQPECADSSDPERVTSYWIPVGPLHRATGRLDFQMFNGEARLSAAVKRIAELEAAITALEQSPPAHPTEAITDAMVAAGANQVPIHYAGFKPDAEELALSIYTAMRAAAPTAPAQDDDAEWYRRFRTSVLLLLQNSEGCAANHYGEDYQGVMPGWLVDCRRDIETGLERISSRLSNNAALVEALEFYAEPSNWHGVYMVGSGPIADDWSDDCGDPAYPDGKPGKRARTTLASTAKPSTDVSGEAK